jgi:chromate transport protein ChrA
LKRIGKTDELSIFVPTPPLGNSKANDDTQYQELFAICQALPGPASTKMCFCIALLHAGIFPAIFAFMLWSLPGAIGMYALSLGVQKMPERLPPIVYALLSGLNASTVGIIALAAVQLAEKAIKDKLTRMLVIFGACAGLCYNALWYFPVLIVCGGVVPVIWDTWLMRWVGKMRARYQARRRRARNEQGDAEEDIQHENIHHTPPVELTRPQAVKRRPQAGSSIVDDATSSREDLTTSQPPNHPVAAVGSPLRNTSEPAVADVKTHNISVKLGATLIIGFTVSFIVIMVLRGTLDSTPRPFALFSNMYLAGTIIFGGGPVVIPLLRSYVVEPGWVTPRDFLLGLAIIQSFPGPNFNFAVYLGALAVSSTSTSTPTIVGAVIGFIGIFVPGIVLAVGVQSFWQVLRTKSYILSLLKGINATAVGLVFTAVYRLWEIGYLTPDSGNGKSLAEEPWWVVVAALAYAETAWFGVPPAVAILFGAVLGMGWFGAVGK